MSPYNMNDPCTTKSQFSRILGSSGYILGTCFGFAKTVHFSAFEIIAAILWTHYFPFFAICIDIFSHHGISLITVNLLLEDVPQGSKQPSCILFGHLIVMLYLLLYNSLPVRKKQGTYFQDRTFWSGLCCFFAYEPYVSDEFTTQDNIECINFIMRHSIIYL